MNDEIITEGNGDSPLLFDSIVRRITPSEQTFEVALATGDVLRFRHVRGRDAFRQIRQAAHRFADGVTPLNAPAEMKPYLPPDRETMIWCHILGALNLDGGGALGFLKIQHFGPVVFDDLLEKFKTALAHVAEQVETQEIDRAKKGSGSRCCGATGSASRSRSGAGTHVNSTATPGKTPC
jgi:hypothetical protein